MTSEAPELTDQQKFEQGKAIIEFLEKFSGTQKRTFEEHVETINALKFLFSELEALHSIRQGMPVGGAALPPPAQPVPPAASTVATAQMP